MEKHEIEQFREVLTAIVASFEQSVRAREEITIESSADTLDQIGDAARRELAAHRLELYTRRIEDANAALKRIEEGTYGMCLACDEQISSNRLRAVPWTRYCIQCQERADRGQNGIELTKRVLSEMWRESTRMHVG